MPDASSMSKKNSMQLSVKHHENMIRETTAWKCVVPSKANVGVCAVDGNGSRSSWMVSSDKDGTGRSE